MPRLSISLDIASNPLSFLYGTTAIYVASGLLPEFIADFTRDFYKTNSGIKTFPNAITHTRASTATYVDSTGTLQTAAVNEPRLGHHVYNGTAWVNEGLLHESEARTNLVVNSSLFTDFNVRVSGQTITGGATFAGLDASTVVLAGDTSTNYRDKGEFVPTASTTYTFSYFVSGTSGVFRIEIDDRDNSGNRFQVSINVSTGAVSHATLINRSDGGAILSSAAQPFGAGWRVSLTFTTGSLAATNMVTMIRRGDVGTYVIAGRQYEIAPTVSSYIPTAGSTVTRSADVLTIPAANLPYPEPVVIGPELVTNGDGSSATGWASPRSNSTLSSVSGALRTTASSAAAFGIAQAITTEIGKVYRLTINVTANTTTASFTPSVRVDNNSDLGTPQNTTTAFASPVEIIFVAAATTMYVGVIGVAGAAGEYLEVDNISVREINPLALSIQMDGRVTYADTDKATEARFVRWLADGNNFILADLATNGTATGSVPFFQTSAGVLDQVTVVNPYSPDVLVPYNIASRHGSTFINGATDGTALTANTTPVALPDLSATNLQLGQTYNGTIRTFRMWGQDIGDAGLVEATEPSLVPSLSLTFDGTENSFIVNDWTS